MEKESAIEHQEKETVPVKSLSGSDLFQHIRELSNAIAHRAFELFNGRGRGDGHDLEDWYRAESELLHPVHLNLAESADAFKVQAEVPGFSAKELEVGVEPQRLTISGKRASSKERTGTKTIYKEQCSTQIYRAIDLPAEVNTSKVTAALKNGVLELSMPKAAKAKKVQIAEKAA